MNECPNCYGPAQVWADNSDGLTVNFACGNPACKAGKGPWDTPRPIVYRLSHPQLSQPLEMESTVARTDRALIAWATMYILREFDEMVTREDWVVQEI